MPDPNADYDFIQVFGRTAPLIVEIGFGNGESLAQMAAANPENDYIGIEVHRPGVGHLMMLLDQQGLTNVRIYCHDAIDIIEQRLPIIAWPAYICSFPIPGRKKNIINGGSSGPVLLSY